MKRAYWTGIRQDNIPKKMCMHLMVRDEVESVAEKAQEKLESIVTLKGAGEAKLCQEQCKAP